MRKIEKSVGKKISTMVGILLLSGAIFGGCGAKQTEAQRNSQDVSAEDTISIVTTVFPPYDFAREIGGKRVEVTMLLPFGVESHAYEPTPQDIIKINKSDLFIYVGGESDTWVTSIMDSLDNENLQTLTLMDCVEVLQEEIVEGMDTGKEEHNDKEENNSKEEKEAEYDEHVWTSPRNASLIAEKIADKLSELDQVHRDEYREQKEVYQKKLEDLDAAYRETVEKAVRKELIFADRFPFRYLTEAYGLSYYAAFPGCSAETEPSAATIAFLIDKVKEDEIPMVLYLELSNTNLADAVSEVTNTQTAMLHSCHNISEADKEAGVTYLSLMHQNLEVLKGALQ